MFREIPSPVPAFRGFRVRTFRQARAALAERTLRGRVFHFVPWKGVAGVFLPAHEFPADAAALEAAWAGASAPLPHPPGPGEALLFGEILRVRPLFAGAEDTWREGGELFLAYRRRPDAEALAARVEAFRRGALLARAEAILAGWEGRLARRPAGLAVWPRLRNRTLGQCMRSGEIRLNPRLADWPAGILEETLAHEAAHLLEFNHSPRFWRALGALLPDWLPRSLVHYLA